MKLMNSAMMPQPGVYNCKQITKEEFCDLLKQADKIESFIGYPQNISLIKEWTGCTIPLCRDNTTFKDGDQALVMRLDYRVKPGTKGRKVDENDFSFFLVTYEN